ncbi:MAG: gamma-glutamyl-gamma-aminobutyrate hydrolase family protein [Bdellovibrio sp.]|nr:gamma-glutamyl-gamma-aminobutyrate hydrolase family protein [Bdellovibrio sp.]
MRALKLASHADTFAVFCLLFFLSFSVVAQVELYILKPNKNQFSYVIPVRSGRSIHSELLEYKKLILANPELADIFTAAQLDKISLGQTYLLKSSNEARILLLANRGYDYEGPASQNAQNRIRRVSEKFSASVNTYVLPVAASIYLNAAEQKEFVKKISDYFSGVVALGGADVDPHLYGENISESREVNASRDRYEISFLKSWMGLKKGFTYGICRGHQIVSVALGFKLIQHVDNHGDGYWVEHPIEIRNTTSNHFKNIFGSRVKVRGTHHQAVQSAPNTRVEVAALAPDGTIEALESADGLIITTQFHPEFMDNYISKKFFSYLRNKAQLKIPNKCAQLFN